MHFLSPPRGSLIPETQLPNHLLIAPWATSLGLLVECLPPVGEKALAPPPHHPGCWQPWPLEGEAPPPSAAASSWAPYLPGRPAPESRNQRLLPHKPQLPGPGEWGAGKHSRDGHRGGVSHPLPFMDNFLYFNSTFVGPAHQKTRQDERPSRKWKCPIWEAPAVRGSPEHLPRARVGITLHREGLVPPWRPFLTPSLRGPTICSLENGVTQGSR